MSPVLLIGLAVLAFAIYEAYIAPMVQGSIASYASTAGFSGTDLVLAVAIAYAESAGDPNAVGDNGDSIGLWQIDTRFHPEYSADSLTDSQTNANAAFAIYQAAGNSFSPWSTFNRDRQGNFVGNGNGYFNDYLDQAQNEVSA